MARGTTLTNLTTWLKAEIGESQDANTVHDAELYYKLATKQKELCTEYDWPFMEDRWEVSLAAGDRYKALPTSNIRTISSTINFERPVRVEVKHNEIWLPVGYGIGAEELNCRDSDQSETMDPVMKWSMDTNTGDATSADQFEVWPMPASAQTIRFIGQRAPRTLATGSDKADLDDLILILFVAAEILAKREQKDAGLKLQKAQSRLLKLRASYPTDDTKLILGGKGTYTREEKRIIPIVGVA